MSLSQGYSVGKVLFLPVLNDSGSDCTIVTLEDTTGLVNLVVRPRIYERYRNALRSSSLLLAEGFLQQEGTAASVLVESVLALRWPTKQKTPPIA
jgi:DNA polymerase III alpha subunit